MPETTSKYASEGKKLHKLAENFFKIDKKNGYVPDDEQRYSQIDLVSVDGKQFPSNAQIQMINEYVFFVCLCPHTIQLIEEKVQIFQDCWGTADCIQIDEALKILRIIDLKCGAGVLVNAEENSQMLLYAAGALNAFDLLYDIEQVELVIYQPLRENTSRWTVSADEVKAFAAHAQLRSLAADFPNAPFCPGPEQCRWCRAKATCRARKDAMLREDFPSFDLLSTDEIAEVLPWLEDLQSWCKDVKEHALYEALKGAKIPGYKLVEGRSVRRWLPLAESELLKHLPEGQIYKKTLVGIPAVEKLLGKSDVINQITEKPAGAPVLVPVGDKRKEINTKQTDFEEKIT